MVPLKELGECLVTVGDRDYFFRPSFMAMLRIGEPAEIVQTFYDLCNDEITPLIQRVVEAYGRVPEWLAKHLSALHLDKKSLLAAHTVLTACCNDDIGDLVGWMKPGKTKRRAFVWHKGVMNPQDMVILAQSLMMHGIIGKAKVRKLQRHETNEKTSEFRAADYVIAARNHFGISREEAENLTMTEFQLMLIAKYPDQKGYTREEYDHAADDYFARRKRRQAKANK